MECAGKHNAMHPPHLPQSAIYRSLRNTTKQIVKSATSAIPATFTISSSVDASKAAMGYLVQDVHYPRLHVHQQTAQLKCLMTTLCDKNSQPSDWVFTADRVNRMMVEFALNFLPTDCTTVTTPVDDEPYEGVKFAGKIVGVSVIRAGEAMETALRSCCRNVRLGKILVQRDEFTANPRYYMAKLPADIAKRHVLLMDPMLATGGSALTAMSKLLEEGVEERNIIFVNVVAAPEGVHTLLAKHPNITFCTACIASGLNRQKFIRQSVGDFGDRYFGTAHSQT